MRSTNTRIVPDDGFKRTDDGDLTFLTLSSLSAGDCRLEAGLGTSIWVTLEVQAGVTATADGNLNDATQRGTYENIDAVAVTRHFHGGHAGTELLGGLSRGYMRWLEIIGGHAVRESSGPPPGVKPIEASFPWKTYSDRPKLLVIRQGLTFPIARSEQVRNYLLEVWWLADNDREYQVLEGHAKRAGAYAIDPDILAWFKARGAGWQDEINGVLAFYRDTIEHPASEPEPQKPSGPP